MMKAHAKTLIPNKEWLLRDDTSKIGTISKCKKGYQLLQKGKSMPFRDLSKIKSYLEITFSDDAKLHQDPENLSHSIYNFPCDSKPYDPVYSIKERLPLYIKSEKSKSVFCAGYYLVKFRKGWVKCFCPKLITLQRYQYEGPFKTEADLKDDNIKNRVINEKT